MEIRITGVPEHFNYPIVQAITKMQPPTAWHYTPEGTGAMIQQLMEGKTDVALLLSEGFTKANCANPGALYFGGFYISSPLVWGVHTGADYRGEAYPRTAPKKVLISRYNSGSHLMFKLLQNKYQWDFSPKFEVINNLKGAIAYAQSNSDFLFLWEKYTTQPYCEKGIFQKVDNLPSPWPAFSIVIHKRLVEKLGIKAVTQWLDELKTGVTAVVNQSNLTDSIAAYSQLPKHRVASWKQETLWLGIDKSEEQTTLRKTQEKMIALGMLERESHFQII